VNDILLPKILGLLVAPPGIVIVVGLLGLFLLIWRRWLGGIFIATALVALFVLSVPLVGKRFLLQVEAPFRAAVITADKLSPNMQAVVVLGGGRSEQAPEYGEETVNRFSLERVRYAAHLARLTGLPLLVSGGSVFGEARSEAELMRDVLERDFSTKVKWVEGSSRTTLENAVRSKKILAEAGIRRVYLVTHAWHMQRAQWAFIEAGLDAVPAPMGFTSIGNADLSVLGHIPTSAGLQATAIALHERLGFYWYKSKRDAAAAAEAVKAPESAK
jgi:uncharacterized SAM-binding protein YcdF (DUF218 family)